MRSRLLTATFVALGVAGTAGAQTPMVVGTFSDWSAYSVSTGGAKICYALAQPKNRKPEGLNRDPAYFFVSTRPAENVKNEISVIVGFPMKAGTETSITVTGSAGNVPFSAYVKDDGAWIREAAEEQRLVEAMRKGRDIVVKGTSLRGNVTTDTYSLAGISAALEKASAECR